MGWVDPLSQRYHRCPGRVCGRDDVPQTQLACPDCMRRLPEHIYRGLTESRHRGSPPSQFLPLIARARIWWDNTLPGGL